jgi:hypothetical protein
VAYGLDIGDEVVDVVLLNAYVVDEERVFVLDGEPSAIPWLSTDPISALKRYEEPVALVTPLSFSQTCWFVREYFEEDTLTFSALVEFGFTHAVTGVLVYARFPIAAAMLPAATPSDGFAEDPITT